MAAAKKRLLTKSRFKIGCQCPTKLYYTDRPAEYANAKNDDPFLRALAEGGFQVGALANLHYPDGVEVAEKDYETSVASTNKLLEAPKVTTFNLKPRLSPNALIDV